MNHFDKLLPRVLTYLPGGGGGGEGGGTLIFSHICRLRPFLGVQNLLISIFLGTFRKIFYLGVYVYINESTPPPPPPTHTHKHWAYMYVYVHQGLVLIAFAHARIQIFTFFTCLFHRGAICLGPLPVSFF